MTVSAGSFDFSRGRRALGSISESWSTYSKCLWASPLEVVREVERTKAESAARPRWTHGMQPITQSLGPRPHELVREVERDEAGAAAHAAEGVGERVRAHAEAVHQHRAQRRRRLCAGLTCQRVHMS